VERDDRFGRLSGRIGDFGSVLLAGCDFIGEPGIGQLEIVDRVERPRARETLMRVQHRELGVHDVTQRRKRALADALQLIQRNLEAIPHGALPPSYGVSATNDSRPITAGKGQKVVLLDIRTAGRVVPLSIKSCRIYALTVVSG